MGVRWECSKKLRQCEGEKGTRDSGIVRRGEGVGLGEEVRDWTFRDTWAGM